MMKEYIMALDQGTTSSRCILFDHAGILGHHPKISVPLVSQTSVKPQSSGIKRPGTPYTMQSSGSVGARLWAEDEE